MKQLFKKLVVVYLLLIPLINLSQVTTKETFPRGDQTITIIFDLKLAKDSRATRLLGKTNDIYLWSGAGTTQDGNAFEYQPAGQTNFNVPFAPGSMTYLGDDKWSIRLNPRSYFNVPSNKPLVKLGLLLKNGSGDAQTEDFILDLYSGGLAVKWLNPTNKTSIYEVNTDITIRGVFSDFVSGSISENGNIIWEIDHADTVNFQINSGNIPGNKRILKLAVTNGNNELIDSLILFNKPKLIEQNPEIDLKPGVNYLGDQVYLRFFAPKKSYVYVLGDFNNWTKSSQYLMKKYPGKEEFWIHLGEFSDHLAHTYQYLIDDELQLADPMATKILDKNNDAYIPSAIYPGLEPFPKKAKGFYVSVFQTGKKTYDWKVSNFTRPNPDNLVIYELLIRDFSDKGNYQSVIDSIHYLKNLGINAIELMPIMEFSGNDSWGYNPIFMTASDKAYGPEEDLKKLIDTAHSHGIAVILDIVLNQQDAGNPYVQMYWDGTKPTEESPFFNSTATHPYSVFYDMNHESLATQWFVDEVVKFWLQEFKIDGYRFDLSKGFTQKKSGSDVSLWGNYDPSRIQLWKRIYDKIRTYDQSAYLILEHFAANNEELELADYGFLLWANAHFDMAAILKGEQRNYTNLDFRSRGFRSPNIVGYIESHDEERLMVEMNANSYAFSQKINRMKLAAGLMFGVKGPKMFWQFGELGYDFSINENGRTGRKPIRWNYYLNADRKSLYDFYAELAYLKQHHPSFNSNYLLETSTNFKRITNTLSDTTWFFIANTATNSSTGNITFPAIGKWFDYFTGDSIRIEQVTNPVNLSSGQFHLWVNQAIFSNRKGLSNWKIPNFTILGNQEESFEDIKVFPNPSSGIVFFEWYANQENYRLVELFDLYGRKLKSWNLNQNPNKKNSIKLDLNFIENSGTYLLVSQGKINKVFIHQ